MPKRPDFTGVWLNTEIESPDADAFFRDGLGLNWAIRQIFKSTNYGCGKMTHVIKQTGDTLHCTVNMPEEKTYEQIGDGVPRKTDATNEAAFLWDGDMMMMIVTKGGGFDMARYLKDGKMITHLSFKDKPELTFRRIFERQDAPAVGIPVATANVISAASHPPTTRSEPSSFNPFDFCGCVGRRPRTVSVS